MSTKKLSLSAVLLAGLLAVFASPGFAQSVTGASAPIEEIVVTSRYREENLADIPDSITAFTLDDIERYRIERVNRVAALTPNLRFSDDQEVGVSTLVIRGVRQNRGTGQPPVSLRVDGVSATNNLLTTQELFDIESIDVLRGPAGSAVRAQRDRRRDPYRHPRTRQRIPSIDYAFGAAQGHDFTLAASASGPITDDTLLYRASLRLQDREGQLKNAYLDNQKVDFKESQSFRGRLLYQPWRTGCRLTFAASI